MILFKLHTALVASKVAYLSHHAVIVIAIIVDRVVWIHHPPLANSTQLNSKGYTKQGSAASHFTFSLLFRQLESNLQLSFYIVMAE